MVALGADNDIMVIESCYDSSCRTVNDKEFFEIRYPMTLRSETGVVRVTLISGNRDFEGGFDGFEGKTMYMCRLCISVLCG